jgi:hypothetical protein
MIFTGGAVCSPRVLKSTEGKNHPFPKICKLFLTVRLILRVMLTDDKNDDKNV